MRLGFPVAVLFTAFVSACGVRPAITTQLTLDFPNDPRAIRIDTVTQFSREVSGEAAHQRVAAARRAIAEERDEWSLRYAAIEPDEERLIVDRRDREIERVERTATLRRNDLPRFFSDTSMTVSLSRVDGVNELTIIPSTSNRATRAQREHAMTTLHLWSEDAARYIEAIGNLYRFIDQNPQRARAAFELLLGDEKQRSTIEEEQSLIEAVRATTNQIYDRLDNHGDAFTIDEEFDLTFNPLPAEIVIHTPRAATANENFFKQSDDTFVIRRAGLLDAIESLEDRWVTPNPLAAALHSDKEMSADEYVKLPRRWSELVTATEIEQAVMDRLKPASVYRLRWNE
jgi:hypothetical protein